jgi:hypothetical protein
MVFHSNFEFWQRTVCALFKAFIADEAAISALQSFSAMSRSLACTERYLAVSVA